MKVIGFCGLPGSGKSTAINSIKDLGIVVNMGDIVRKEAEKRNIEPTGENLGKIARSLRENRGEDIIAHKCVRLIENLNSKVVFVDGIRSVQELNLFRSYWKFPLIEIATTEKIRYQRIAERYRSDDYRSANQIIERDKREISFGLKELLEKVDYTITNNSTKEDLKRKIRKVVRNIIETY
jgi:dephospho-CoA kinase